MDIKCGLAPPPDAEVERSTPGLDKFFDLSRDLLCIVGVDGRFKCVNPACERTLGYTVSELLATPFARLIHPDERSTILDELSALGRGEQTIGFEGRFRKRDDSYCRLEWTATLSPDGFIYATARDVTERRKHERALETARERYRRLFDHAPDAILLLDMEAERFVDANRVAERLFKLSREELLKVGPVEMSPPFQPDGRRSSEAARRRIEEAFDGAVPRFEWMHRDAEGRDFLCEISVLRMPGSTKLVRGSIVDITERRRLEQELQQSRKMETIGQLVGGVAHDFNNLLMVIDGFAAAALEKLDGDSDVAADIREIRGAGERAVSLTGPLLAFSRKQAVRPTVLDVNSVVQGLAGVLRRLIGENIELSTELDAALPRVEADPGQIEQIIINLSVNARDALPDGGRLTISTRRVVAGERGVADLPAPPSGEYAVLTVADDGPGIPPEVQQHIFEPFFTTKDQGRGTGLGLSTVFGIVRQNGGRIAVDSKPGAGARFDIYLPASEKRVQRAHTRLPSPEQKRIS